MASLSQTIFTSFLLLNAAQGLLAAPEMAGQSRDGDSEENPTRQKISEIVNGNTPPAGETSKGAQDGSASSALTVQPPERLTVDPVSHAPPAPTLPLPPTPIGPGIPRAPNFTAGSFFIGFCVALTLVGMAFAGVRFWMRCRRNTSGHTVY